MVRDAFAFALFALLATVMTPALAARLSAGSTIADGSLQAETSQHSGKSQLGFVPELAPPDSKQAVRVNFKPKDPKLSETIRDPTTTPVPVRKGMGDWGLPLMWYHWRTSTEQPTEDVAADHEAHTSPEDGGQKLLPLQTDKYVDRKTLVLDIDQTLVHSSLRPMNNTDLIITVDGKKLYVRKRPGVDKFLAKLSALFELVTWTASGPKFASPMLDKLDPNGFIVHRLFTEACTQTPKGPVKDLNLLGRSLSKVIIIDNTPRSYELQPDNAIPIETWYEDPTDCGLEDLLPILIPLSEPDIDDIPALLSQLKASQALPRTCHLGGKHPPM